MSFLVEKLDKPLPVHSKFRKKIIELSQVNTKDLVNYVINDNNILLPIFQARNAVVTEDYHSRIGSYGIDKLDFFWSRIA
ncbi:hypothetical protein F994_02946 [Acinetobacter bohemicus ANC 3994]|uniref:Uncharacterized protein n=1 Tax=Acinetobacter bohemicus ANC 3994 TaxID=1217715 RepID=N8QBJ6_9GAMM|nr:hypothetical protein [Acinetobacter bohemicus]ENU18624.1 hypothetical protein F994_02946 [Acinetobacter bohemicus ANC 3994]